jgi:hypothetical protein
LAGFFLEVLLPAMMGETEPVTLLTKVLPRVGIQRHALLVNADGVATARMEAMSRRRASACGERGEPYVRTFSLDFCVFITEFNIGST